MTIPSHILLGAVIGTITGDVPTAIAVSVLVDTDHLISYARHGLLTKPKKFWRTITDQSDPWGDQRGYLHNIFIAGTISLFALLIGKQFALTVTLAYFGHLFLDALDTSDYWPFYPSKKINLKGFIRYYSLQEIIFDIFLIVFLVFFCG